MKNVATGFGIGLGFVFGVLAALGLVAGFVFYLTADFADDSTFAAIQTDDHPTDSTSSTTVTQKRPMPTVGPLKYYGDQQDGSINIRYYLLTGPIDRDSFDLVVDDEVLRARSPMTLVVVLKQSFLGRSIDGRQIKAIATYNKIHGEISKQVFATTLYGDEQNLRFDPKNCFD